MALTILTLARKRSISVCGFFLPVSQISQNSYRLIGTPLTSYLSSSSLFVSDNLVELGGYATGL